MSALPEKLLGAALRVKWEIGHSQDQRAIELLAERVPGFTPEQYTEAGSRAADLDSAGYDLAAAWFANGGKGPFPTADALKACCPGFSDTDYAEVVNNNVTCARK